MFLMTLSKLNKLIIDCRQCERLVNFREKIATEKRKQYIDEEYWGKPITGYGDEKAKLLMVGLAPAAHGGNRTGRVFTGDKSADFLFKCLFEAGFCNQPISVDKKDGLLLDNLYLTTALKCVPPGDKPKNDELIKCSNYFISELEQLKKLKVIVALGKVAFDNCLKIYKKKFNINKKFEFKHGKKYLLPDNRILIACYHPSPRNVNTKVITPLMINSLFKKAKKFSTL